MKSTAASVTEYLAGLPEERRMAIEKIRQVILDNLPTGYEEGMNWGMITYQVPLNRYPDTYNGQPLMYAALASQKNHMAVYLTSIYASKIAFRDFVKAYKASGKKVDMGKSCVRFKKLEDLPLELIGQTIASVIPDKFIELTEKVFNTKRKKRR